MDSVSKTRSPWTRRLTWVEWRDLGTTWKPRVLRGGSVANRCEDHRGRSSVWIVDRDGRWIDTGLCAPDMDALQRATLKMKKGGPA